MSQNRAVEQRSGNKPTLADIRESGAIEQDADVIIFIYRDNEQVKNNPAARNVIKIDIAKQRNGPTGSINLTFLSNCTKFVDHSGASYEAEEEVY